jgi:hypothetical protein
MPAPVILLAPAALEAMRLAVNFVIVYGQSEARRQQYELEMRAIELEASRVSADQELRLTALALVRHALDRKFDAMVDMFHRTHEALVVSQRAVDDQLNALAEYRFRGTLNADQTVEIRHREMDLQRNREALDLHLREVGLEFARLVQTLRIQGLMELKAPLAIGRGPLS